MSDKRGLSKSRVLLNQQCPRRLWLKAYRPDLEEIDEGMDARFRVGDAVGSIARDLHPHGFLMDDDLQEALQQTHQAMHQVPRPLFEATFQHDGTLVRADLMLPDAHGWRMVEVKSSTSVKEYHLPDAAIQTWVLLWNDVALSKVELAHINNQFVYPGDGDYDGLLRHVDITPEVMKLQSDVPGWIADAHQTLKLKSEPDIAPGSQCTHPFECSFRQYCDAAALEPPPEYSFAVLPRGTGAGIKAALSPEGLDDIRTLNEEDFTKPEHRRIWRAVCAQKAELDDQARIATSELGWPRYYIDFETINPAIPIWTGTRPYQQVPFQWSCHIETRDGLRHEAFLADGCGDPRRPFIESLLDTVGSKGPVIVYNAAFEKTRLRETADAFPDLADAIQSVIDRMFDLLPLARENYYHPAMLGSWSIKAVLPTIAPDLNYKDLGVSDGGAAQDAFTEILDPESSDERKDELRQQLLDYCALDTLAMVRICQYFSYVRP